MPPPMEPMPPEWVGHLVRHLRQMKGKEEEITGGIKIRKRSEELS